MSTPILLIPGLNATARVFQAQLPLLWQFGPVMVADNRQAPTMKEMASAILRDAPPKFILGGFSMGGYVAFEVLRQAPERVLKLILIDTQARPDTAEATESRRRGIALAQAGKLEQAAAGTFPNAVHPDNVENNLLRGIHLDMARAIGAAAYERQQEATIARPDSGPDLKSIKVPTLIIVGDSDKITPPEASRELEAGIVGSQLVVIERAGHLAVLEQPLAVNAALETFLSQ